MKRNREDIYYIQADHQPGPSQIAVLSELYLPLIGRDALSLYLVLSSESMLNRGPEKHQRLLVLTDMTIDALDRAFAALEEYMLLKSWMKEVTSSSSFIYCLNAPLSPEDFLHNRIFMAAYRKRTGKQEYDGSCTRFSTDRISFDGYRDVTAPVKNVMEAATAFDKAFPENVKPDYHFSQNDSDIHFDYEKFIATTSTLVFPAVMRTPENMSLIGRLATVFGLNADTMRILTAKCVNLDTMEFDQEKLRFLAEKSSPDIRKAEDPYDLSPVSFLQSKQNGARVSQTDRRILEHLSVDMHFSNAVINVMMEYILKVSDNRINSRFVDMVAGEWARSGVKDKKQALAQAKKDLAQNEHHTSLQRIDLPSYMKELPAPDRRKATREEIEAFEKLQKETGNENG